MSRSLLSNSAVNKAVIWPGIPPGGSLALVLGGLGSLFWGGRHFARGRGLWQEGLKLRRNGGTQPMSEMRPLGRGPPAQRAEPLWVLQLTCVPLPTPRAPSSPSVAGRQPGLTLMGGGFSQQPLSLLALYVAGPCGPPPPCVTHLRDVPEAICAVPPAPQHPYLGVQPTAWEQEPAGGAWLCVNVAATESGPRL